MPAGRPTDYRPEMVREVEKLCELGATDIEIADFFDISIQTLHRWRAIHPEFSEATKIGKAAADERVKRALYARATGYTFDAVKIMTVAGPAGEGSRIEEVPYREHVPPDTGACMAWLKNRDPANWRDRIEHTGKDGGPIQTETRHSVVSDLLNALGEG